jgi:Ca2+-binding EF-hand superfamily protein
MIDANHDGMITGGEARRAYQRYVRGALLVGALKKMDTNKDGLISAAEYKGPKAGFARLDRNKDQRIGPGEVGLVFRMAMHRSQPAASRTAAATAPKAVKPASATTAPKANVAKPASAVKTPPAKPATPAAARPVAWVQRLKRIDADKDGTITKAEYIKACQARWAMLDRDKNGSISTADVVKIVTALRAKAAPKAAAPKSAAVKTTAVKATAAKATCASKTKAARTTAVEKPAAPKPASVKKPATPAVARPTQAPPVAVRLFLGLDANKDGKLLKAELMKGIATWFDRIDSDHNNAVTRGEVQAVVAKLHK